MHKTKKNRAFSRALTEVLEKRSLLSAVATETTLTVPTGALLGQTITLVASVKTATGDAVPSGTVNLLDNGQSTGLAGSVNAQGIATFVFGPGNGVYVGSYTLEAQYAGTSTDLTSTSGNSTLTVGQPTFTTQNDGLEVASVTPGSGSGAVTGNIITAQYTGFYASNGSEFDESASHAPGSFVFKLNNNPEDVITGFDEGATGMEAGETRVLVIPSALGYKDGQVRVFILHCLTIGTSKTVAAASHLAFDEVPATATTGGVTAPPIIAEVVDINNDLDSNSVSNMVLSIATGPQGAALGGTTTVAAQGGVASFNDITFNMPGAYTLTVTDAGDGVAPITSISITVTSFATLSGGILTIAGTGNADNISITDNGGAVDAIENGVTEGPFANVTGIVASGGAGNDTISAMGVPIPCTLGGAGGNDSIVGGAGNDSIKGGAGSDTLGGAGGDDTIVGGGDGDSLKGGAGNDFIAGGPGNNSIHGGTGNDSIISGAGNNIVNGNDGNDTIVAGAGSSQLFAGPGSDSLTGGVSLGDNADSIFCGGSADTILAGANDSIFDTVPGDQITGGHIVS